MLICKAQTETASLERSATRRLEGKTWNVIAVSSTLAETPTLTVHMGKAGQWNGHGWVHCKRQVSSFQVDLLGLCLAPA